jgi:hypothetical protein
MFINININMGDLITYFLKNIGCSQCQEYEYQDNKENLKDWKLYLKEYEMYSAMILYNPSLKKDISYFINKNEKIILINKEKEIYLELEFILLDENNNSVLVPTNDYMHIYEKIEELDKELDKEINAYYIGMYDVQK